MTFDGLKVLVTFFSDQGLPFFSICDGLIVCYTFVSDQGLLLFPTFDGPVAYVSALKVLHP